MLSYREPSTSDFVKYSLVVSIDNIWHKNCELKVAPAKWTRLYEGRTDDKRSLVWHTSKVFVFQHNIFDEGMTMQLRFMSSTSNLLIF